MNKPDHTAGAPDTAGVNLFEEELTRINRQKLLLGVLKNTLITLAVVSAAAVLVAVIFLPVLRIYGTSMSPTFEEGEIVVSLKNSKVDTGDIVAVYYGSKLLVKRCIAHAGQWVDIDPDGTVYVYDDVKDKPLDEPYVTEKAFGDCDLELPYQVPADAVFVMGDHRATSADSRLSSIGCIETGQIVGKIVFRIWPLGRFGKVE